MSRGEWTSATWSFENVDSFSKLLDFIDLYQYYTIRRCETRERILEQENLLHITLTDFPFITLRYPYCHKWKWVVSFRRSDSFFLSQYRGLHFQSFWIVLHVTYFGYSRIRVKLSKNKSGIIEIDKRKEKVSDRGIK